MLFSRGTYNEKGCCNGNLSLQSHPVQYRQHSMQTICAYCHYPENWLGMSESLKPNSSAPWFACFKRAPFANILKQVHSHFRVSCWGLCKSLTGLWAHISYCQILILQHDLAYIFLSTHSLSSFFQLSCPNYILLLSSTVFLKWNKWEYDHS